jgi:S1-C subfamily serine protease
VIPGLGVLGVDITEQTALLVPALRRPSGVMVVGHTREEANGADTGLTTGDTIHSINGVSVASMDQVRTVLASLKPQSPVVLQIERNGQMMFLTFELD